jgi:hypothetical protein
VKRQRFLKGLRVRRDRGDESVTGKGADPDTLVASAKAYLGALNKLMVRRQRGAVVQHLGRPRVTWDFRFGMAAYNLVRMTKLAGEPA